MTVVSRYPLSSRIAPALLATAVLLLPLKTRAQESFKERFLAHNYRMTFLQPSWPTPLVQPDPRLTQYYRFSASDEYTSAGDRIVNYGNGHGGGIIGWTHCEFDFYPPSYLEHNSPGKDGIGDTELLMKYRIVSGNEKHGDYIVTAILGHSFATGTHTNGAETDGWSPTIAGGVGVFKRIHAESSIGGNMPAGKIASQGRSMVWNALGMVHLADNLWLDVENNANYYFSGPHDSRMQNFVTPATFYTFRSKNWTHTHPFLTFGIGMQIASSSFHTYNHNVISEIRILF